MTPRLQTYELRDQGKKEMTKIKTNKHLTLTYKNDTHPLKWDIELRGHVSKKSTFFKELKPRSRTYELRGQGEKKRRNDQNQDK